MMHATPAVVFALQHTAEISFARLHGPVLMSAQRNPGGMSTSGENCSFVAGEHCTL
jgi:hypothetical protein